MNRKKKIAIIGASYLQEPLITKAKAKGLETYVFAWECGDVGEYIADYFYPISIIEKDLILEKCMEIGIDGICSIASDLASITVNYVAEKMGLIGNSMSVVEVSTNKHKMRECFAKHGDPSPKSVQVSSIADLEGISFQYPIIVKPVDRSGSRGITKLESEQGLSEAIKKAKEQGFKKVALVEEFAMGKEYSVEYITWKGQHHFLAVTQKYTTGAPSFIETGHLEPALIDSKTLKNIKKVVEHALSSLGIMYGASHSELKINDEGIIYIIEIGARMGGDCIGSSLVELSTGFDFVSAVIDIALGTEPIVETNSINNAAIRFVFGNEDVEYLNKLKEEHPEVLIAENVDEIKDIKVLDSSARYGYYLMAGKREVLNQYMPSQEAE